MLGSSHHPSCSILTNTRVSTRATPRAAPGGAPPARAQRESRLLGVEALDPDSRPAVTVGELGRLPAARRDPGGPGRAHARDLTARQLDVTTAPALAEPLRKASYAGKTAIAIDLGELTFMDSTGLMVLNGLHRVVRQ